MSRLVQERLGGCTAQSLDSYLRGVGFFLLAGQIEPTIRAWWDEDGVMSLASPSIERLLSPLVALVRCEDFRAVRTPWRGAPGRGSDFVALRNDAEEDELDWFDACAVPRIATDDDRRADTERSENNPLLGQGGAFGNQKPAEAYVDALVRLRDVRLAAECAATCLLSAISAQPLELKLAKRVAVSKKALGAYQSGRATGPGASSKDVEATAQNARTNAWDVILVLNGLRAFRGALARRPDPRARVQASFPFLVRSRAIGTGPGKIHELREDDPLAFEFLAPLWSVPCTPRTLCRLVSSARLRVPRGVARDTLDAVLVQASRSGQGLGFDRLVRFALVAASSDPHYRFAVRRAVRRGTVHARGLESARQALDEIAPFLRDLDRHVDAEPPSLLTARRRLEDALAAFGRDGGDDRRQTQEVLVSLALFERPAAAAAPELGAPRLSRDWLRLADDGSSECRLARALVTGLTDSATGASILRQTLLPQARGDDGVFRLDPSRTPPDLERIGNPVSELCRLCLGVLRRTPTERIVRRGSTQFDDLALLLAAELSGRRLALLALAFAGVGAPRAQAGPPQDPLAHGLGTDVARLLLAGQPSGDDDDGVLASLALAERLASLLLAGRVDAARVVADRELRRRGLALLPPPPPSARAPAPELLALAVLLPLDAAARAELEHVVCVTSPERSAA